MTDNCKPGWVLASGDDLVDVVRGVTYRKPDASSEPGQSKVAILRAGNLQNGSIKLDDLVYVSRDLVKAKQLLRQGDIVVAMSSGSRSIVGKAAPIEIEMRDVSFGAFCGVLRPRLPDVSAWARWYFQSKAYRDTVSELSKGVNINNLKPAHIQGLEIPLAPLNEQRRIVAKIEALTGKSRRAKEALDAIPPLLERFRQSVLAAAFRGDLTADWRARNPNVEPADQLLTRIRGERRARWEQAAFAKMRAKGKEPKNDKWKAKYKEPDAVDAVGLPELPAGWRWASWEQVGFCQNGRAFPSKEYRDDGVKLLRPGNLDVSGGVSWSAGATRRLPEQWAEKHPEHLVGGGELIMNLTAQSLKDEFLGRICVTPQGDRSLLNQRLARLTPVGASSEFAFWVFKSPVFRRFVDGLNTGSLIQHMFTSNIYEFVFPMPPLMEQAVLVERLDDVHRRLDALRSASGRSRNRLVAVDQAVLAKGFRGELVPQNRDDEPALALLGRAAVGKCEQST